MMLGEELREQAFRRRAGVAEPGSSRNDLYFLLSHTLHLSHVIRTKIEWYQHRLADSAQKSYPLLDWAVQFWL